MTAIAMPIRGEIGARRRMNWSMVASGVVHTALLALLVLWHPSGGKLPELTEITLIESGDAGTPAPASAAPPAAPRTAAGVITPHASDEHFQRHAEDAHVAPTPQSADALDDRLDARLAALQSRASAPSAGNVTGAPAAMWSHPATVPGSGGGSAPIALTRGGGSGGGPALALTRGGTHEYAAAIARAPRIERAEEAAPAKAGETTARRTLAGATLMGPIADRAVLAHVSPEYPEWAKRDAVEGSVTLYFVVRPDGSVKENVLVQKTAGFEDFDENARAALRAWRFEPLGGGSVGEQWGTITFHFRLQGGG